MRIRPRHLLKALVGAAALSLAGAPSAKVGSITLWGLAEEAHLVVLARTASVAAPGEFGEPRLAELEVLERWSGKLPTKLVVDVAPREICDVSHAEVGETALFFLVRISGETPSSPAVYRVLHSGRGRMPVREYQGEQWVESWRDVIPPFEVRASHEPPPGAAAALSERKLTHWWATLKAVKRLVTGVP